MYICEPFILQTNLNGAPLSPAPARAAAVLPAPQHCTRLLSSALALVASSGARALAHLTRRIHPHATANCDCPVGAFSKLFLLFILYIADCRYASGWGSQWSQGLFCSFRSSLQVADTDTDRRRHRTFALHEKRERGRLSRLTSELAGRTRLPAARVAPGRPRHPDARGATASA